jgi:hypothetical protein
MATRAPGKSQPVTGQLHGQVTTIAVELLVALLDAGVGECGYRARKEKAPGLATGG